MTKYLLIEDERFAREEIKRMMLKLRPNYRLCGWAESVEQAADMIRETDADIIIADIRLTDGLCFEIFEHVDVKIPVIFTTAYDEYAIKAFRANGIHYILKPIDEQELKTALERFERQPPATDRTERLRNAETDYLKTGCKSRFMIRVGDSFYHVETADTAFFYSEEKYTYLHLLNGRRYIIDYSLDQLEAQLDRNSFFRVSRNCIANIKSIRKCSRFFGSRLRLHFTPDCPHEILVTRNRTGDFLKWFDNRL